MNPTYSKTVALLLEVAPIVFNTASLAMKGGTALNLFVQDIPRLSVDIDVVFCDHKMNREQALESIADESQRIEQAVVALGYAARIIKTRDGDEAKLLVSSGDVSVKVEINFVFRGTLLPVHSRPLTPSTQKLFATNVTLPVLATEELYGSKLVAAMDRQHPRDIFDVLMMYESGGLKPEMVDCFVAYLAGHNRPIHEVLFCNLQSLEDRYYNEFEGMTMQPVSLHTLEQTQRQLMDELPAALTDKHREFLLTLVQCKPEWALMPFAHLAELPAIKWKLQNLATLQSKNPRLFARQYELLLNRL